MPSYEAAGAPRRVLAKAFPISIDSQHFEELARKPEIQARAREIREGLGNPKTVMLASTRLDYTKGIGHRLKAFGELLEEGRLRVEDVTLVQVANPSRERVQAYIELRDEIELTVGRINGDFSTMSHTAISYHHHGYPREEMVALYLAADVMLVTALRDGMNLVAKEYVASRFDNDGVLILSEFAGASDELRRSLRINPHDIDGLKDAIVQAIEMPPRGTGPSDALDAHPRAAQQRGPLVGRLPEGPARNGRGQSAGGRRGSTRRRGVDVRAGA